MFSTSKWRATLVRDDPDEKKMRVVHPSVIRGILEMQGNLEKSLAENLLPNAGLQG
jgi:hypothetical protein